MIAYRIWVISSMEADKEIATDDGPKKSYAGIPEAAFVVSQ